LSVITQFDGRLFTFGDGHHGCDFYSKTPPALLAGGAVR